MCGSNHCNSNSIVLLILGGRLALLLCVCLPFKLEPRMWEIYGSKFYFVLYWSTIWRHYLSLIVKCNSYILCFKMRLSLLSLYIDWKCWIDPWETKGMFIVHSEVSYKDSGIKYFQQQSSNSLWIINVQIVLLFGFEFHSDRVSQLDSNAVSELQP